MMKNRIPYFFSSENPITFYSLFILFTVCILYFISPTFNFTQKFFAVDDIIPHDIVAEQDILIKDISASQLKTNELLSQLAMVFDYDPLTYQRIEKRFVDELNQIKQAFTDFEAKQEELSLLIEENKIDQFDSQIEQTSLNKALEQLKKYQLWLDKKTDDVPSFEIGQTKNKAQQIEEQLVAINAHLVNLLENKSKLESQLLQLETSQKSFIEEQSQAFLNNIGVKVELNDPLLLKKEFYFLPLENIINQVFADFYNKPIVFKKYISSLGTEYKKASLINLENQEQITIEDADTILKVEDVKERIKNQLAALITTDQLNTYHKIIERLLYEITDASLSLNKREIELQKDEVVNNAGNVYTSFKKGEMLIRRGIKVNQEQINLINSYFRETTKIRKIPQLIGIFIIIIIALYLSFRILKEKYKTTKAKKSTLMILLSLLVTLAFSHFWSIISYNLALAYPIVPATALLFAMPIVISTMILRVLTDFHLSLHAAIITSLFVAIMLQFDFIFFCYAFITSVTATLPLVKSDRLAFLKHGLKISLAAMSFIIIMLLIGEIPLDNSLIFYFLSAFLTGILAPIFVLFLMPIFEYIFDITTEMKLLELSNMNHPVLKKLLQVAPGTYQHSIMVGTIAEAGALQISANSLLCRVAAYYHDIGKQSNPEYFIENVSKDDESIHIKLDNPQQSASIIINHVAEGVKIAKENNLGSAITNIIREHHGQSLVKYFYNVAVKEKTKIVREIYQTDYRYTGPKPQSLEAAVVMLADTSEAATRSMSQHDMGQIQKTVHGIFDDFLTDGQLDESGMTFTQFKILKDLFSQIIASVYHQRVEYEPPPYQ